jgi:5'' nucleotidase, deoxy (Pyrimidine), cytosolic type C protein (NT5C).
MFSKIWKNYLNEIKKDNKKTQIYCDMDGVLVDFEGGAVQYINGDLATPSNVPKELTKHFHKLQSKLENLGRDQEIAITDLTRDPERRIQEVRRYMYRRLEDNFEFWQNLSWTNDGKSLWNYLTSVSPQVKILTAPMQGEGSRNGKIAWVQKNLGKQYEVILEEDKWKHADSHRLLIDDTFEKVKGWSDNNGIVIHHMNAEDTLARLKELVSVG